MDMYEKNEILQFICKKNHYYMIFSLSMAVFLYPLH